MTPRKPQPNGRLHLTIPQLVWGAMVLGSLLAQWWRMEIRMNDLETALALQPSPVVLEARLGQIKSDAAIMDSRYNALESRVRINEEAIRRLNHGR